MDHACATDAVGAALDAIGQATIGLDAPLAALYLPNMRNNLADLRRRAGHTPIRVASKSVRCRAVLREILGPQLDTDAGREGFRGIMAYSPREAIWLVQSGCTDVLLGYPTVHRAALTDIAQNPELLDAIVLMVDDTRQLEIAHECGINGARVCIDVDASLRVGGIHIGTRRSPLHTVDDVRDLAIEALRLGFHPVGVMFYEAQVAGLPDDIPGISVIKRASMRRLLHQRQAAVQAVQAVTGHQPVFVNSGGTGSLTESAADPVVTEVTAGSGIYAPQLFDRYRSFTPQPALFFALPAVRTPARGLTTFAYGGYVASGVAARDRLPVPVRPAGMSLLGTEGAGEVQTPVRGEVGIGGRSWWRHVKAGELCERFTQLHVVDDIDGRPELVDVWPTYRGEGKCFG